MAKNTFFEKKEIYYLGIFCLIERKGKGIAFKATGNVFLNNSDYYILYHFELLFLLF